jgi:peptidoglycan/xylan/chitin deacetylase (PgdA/CDA1 family)
MFALLRYSGIPRLLRGLLQRSRVTILVYHDLPAQLAEVHFRALQRRYNLIPLSDYIKARQGLAVSRLPRRSLIITFDDGHKDNFSLLPVLQKHRIPVAIFLCSGVVATRRHYWWSHAGDSSKVESLKMVRNELRKSRLLERGHRDTREYDERHALSGAEIQQMQRSVDFQSHTVFHPVLPTCSDVEAEWEVARSKVDLERTFGLDIRAIAYPNGDHGPREVAFAKKAGYQCALSLDCGFNDLHTDLYRLRRIPIPDDASLSELLVKASGLWELVRAWRNKRSAKHDLYPNVASNPHDPSPLIPLPAHFTRLACTGAGRGQGEGQAPLRMEGHHETERPVSFSP